VPSRRKRAIVVGSLSVLLVLVFAVVAGGFLVLQTSALVPPNQSIDSLDFRRAQMLMRRTEYALARTTRLAEISATQHELDSLAMFAARSIDRLSGTVQVTSDAVRFMGSYDVGRNPLGRYVNIALTVRRSEAGLGIASLDIGNLHLGPRLTRFVVNRGLSLVLGSKLSSDAMASISGVSISGDVVTLTVRPDATIEERIKDRVANARTDTPRATVAAYYRDVMQLDSTYDHDRQIPFVDFLQPILAKAAERSKQSDPVVEMRGAVLALALYFGGRRLEDLRHSFLPENLADLPEPDTDYVVLRGHHDHLQHFIVSAGFTVSGGVGFTTVIGEAKELDDLRRGGEDFSFQDLAADRAGIDFARAAQTSSGARHIESMGNRPRSEDLFFPDVSDLPDSMSPARFAEQYRSIDDPAFKAVLADIDRRIHTCEAYRSAR
jgi:hypothetical protein